MKDWRKLTHRKGDNGQTDLWSGERVSKTNHRIIAVGKLDTVNAHIGELRVRIDGLEMLDKIMSKIQRDLFNIMGCISSTGTPISLECILSDIESTYECIASQLNSLDDKQSDWMVYGENGDCRSTQASLVTTVVREAEICVLSCVDNEPDSNTCFNDILLYLNRLSKITFMLARLIPIISE